MSLDRRKTEYGKNTCSIRWTGTHQHVKDWKIAGKMKRVFVLRWDYKYSLWTNGYFYNLIDEKIITKPNYIQENHSILLFVRENKRIV